MYIFKSGDGAVKVVRFITSKVDLGKERTKKERVWCAALISVWKWEQAKNTKTRFGLGINDCGLCVEFNRSNDNCSHCPLSESNLTHTCNDGCGAGSLYNNAFVHLKIDPLIDELKRIAENLSGDKVAK